MKVYNGPPHLREILNDVTEGISVWIKEVNFPELPIPYINSKKIEDFFRDNPYMENKVVERTRFLDTGDYLIIIH